MTDFSRRTFVHGAGALSAASSLALPLTAPAAEPAKLSDIDHVVIMMQENRSFDHYFGTLRGVRGFDDPNGLFRQPDGENPDGYALPFHLDTQRTSAQMLHDLNHDWFPQHAAWNGGRMDGWLATHRAVDRDDSGPLTMGYLERADLPYYYALADAFTICDGYHCSVLGPTHPNRFYLWTATNDPDGKHGGPAIDNQTYLKGAIYDWETYPEALQRAGVSWRIYHDYDDFGINVVKYFKRIEAAPVTSPLFDNALRNRPLAQLLADIRTGNIPQVTWICAPGEFTEHPNYLSAAGEHYTAQILGALTANRKLWAKTAFFLMYDENDGQFDHVAPPIPPPGTPGEFVKGLPVGLGFRVPLLIVSPFSRGGYVCGDTFDHTSVLRFLETRFGVEIPNLSAWRRATCGDLTSAFGFGEPPRFDVPALPPTAAALEAAERNAATLPKPQPPLVQTATRQEPGTRPRRGRTA